MWKDFLDDQIDWDNWSYDEHWEDQNDQQEVKVTDSNGNQLFAGDSVAAIKDIKVKGASDIKRGDKFKNIRLTDDPELIESGKMVLRTEFFKKI